VSAPRYEHRLNAARLSGLDPALTLAASVMIVAVADARDFDFPARQADAVGWLRRRRAVVCVAGRGRAAGGCAGRDGLNERNTAMNLTMPSGLGAILAIIVLVLAILGLLHVLPFTAPVVFGMLAVLAVARLT
jgi:hypothetical protein